MKKLLAIVLALVFCLSLVACGGGGDPEAVAKYVEENKAAIMEGMGASLPGMDADVKADGNKIVVSMSSSQFDNITEEQKELAQANFESASEMYDGIFEALKKECPDAGALVYEIRDSSNNIVFSVTID